jgi:hypothetical protein
MSIWLLRPENVKNFKSYRKNEQDASNRVVEFIIPIAQHVSSDTPLIIRSSKTVIAAFGFT